MNTGTGRAEERMQRFEGAARAAGVKMTHQRLEIFRELAASVEHPDAEAIYKSVRRRVPTVSLDTVYRTLWLLDELGVVATLGPRRGSVRFDPNLEPHHHFVCIKCGLARDFTSDELDALRIPASVRSLGTVVSTHVEVRGLCARCAPEKPVRPTRKAPAAPAGRTRSK